MAQSSNAERTHKNLSSQNREKCVALVGEAVELQAVALVENCFVH